MLQSYSGSMMRIQHVVHLYNCTDATKIFVEKLGSASLHGRIFAQFSKLFLDQVHKNCK